MLKTTFQVYRLLVLSVILTAFFLRIPILKVRYFDPDEFQHLHSARQIYRSELPYRDYFEHHTPLIHFLLCMLYPIVGEEIQILFVARAIMMILTGLILVLTFMIAKQVYGTDNALFAVALLSYVLMFLEKTIEIRPDLLGVAFWLLTIAMITRSMQRNGSRKLHLLAGLSMGLAIMSTQKTLFCLPGMVIAILFPFFDRRIQITWKDNLRLIALFMGGMLIPISTICLFFLANQALWDFINCNFVMNFQWRLRFKPYGYIKQLIRQNPFFVTTSLGGLLANTLLAFKDTRSGRFVPLLCTYSPLIGLFIMPVPYRQYYQLFLPMLSMYSAYILNAISEADISDLLKKAIPLRQRMLKLSLGISITVLVCIGLFYSLRYSRPGLPNLQRFIVENVHIQRIGSVSPQLIYIMLWLIFGIFCIVTFILHKRKYSVLLLLIAMISHPLDQMMDQFHQRNDGQLSNIQYILSCTEPYDTVLDGWSGYGFLRQHAYYYYFLHSEMRAMLTEKQLTDDIIESLEKNNTKFVIYDGDIRALPKKTQDYIYMNYVPTGQDEIYVRKSQREETIGHPQTECY